MKISFKKLEISHKQKRVLALALAVFTAPYLFFVPSQLLYSHNTEVQFFTNHIVPNTHYRVDISYTEPETGDDETATIPDYKEYSRTFSDGINTAAKVRLAEETIKNLGDAEASLRFYNPQQDYGETVVPFWFDTQNNAVYFQYGGSWYQFGEPHTTKALAAWQDVLSGGLGIEFEIVDEAELNNLLVPQALEKIYEDADYTYYLSSMRSQYIFIEYFDDISGITQRVDLVKALYSGIVTVEQLIDKGLDIIEEPKQKL